MTTSAAIKLSLDSIEQREAHRLYDAALSFVSLAIVFKSEALVPTAQKLLEEARDLMLEPHERDILNQLASFLFSEANNRGP